QRVPGLVRRYRFRHRRLRHAALRRRPGVARRLGGCALYPPLSRPSSAARRHFRLAALRAASLQHHRGPAYRGLSHRPAPDGFRAGRPRSDFRRGLAPLRPAYPKYRRDHPRPDLAFRARRALRQAGRAALTAVAPALADDTKTPAFTYDAVLTTDFDDLASGGLKPGISVLKNVDLTAAWKG